MKAVIFNGSACDDGVASDIARCVADELSNAGWQVERLDIRDKKIAACAGCFGCWIRTPGMCVIEDDGRDVARKIVQNDLVVLLTPVTFGGYSYELKKALDRFIPTILPTFTLVRGEIHHGRRYKKYPKLIAIGTLPANDVELEKTFKALVARNAINMNSPSYATGIVIKGASGDILRQEMIGLLRSVEAVA